jgi:hypothetical protein
MRIALAMAARGIQFAAVTGGMKNPVVQTESGPAWVAILALPAQTRP